MSLGAYARRGGVSKVAVSKAIAAGRFHASVVRIDGAPKIGDPDLADREWAANSRPGPGPAASEASPPRTTRAERSLNARREAARADLAEHELTERRARLIDAEEVRRAVPEK
jgi:hypothetical protein